MAQRLRKTRYDHETAGDLRLVSKPLRTPTAFTADKGPTNRIGAIYVALISVIALFYRFHAGSDFLAYYEDDFFYYLKVAQNVARGGASTFDGIHPTNGYHPLWLLLMAGIFKVAPAKGFYLLEAVSAACVVGVYWFSRKLLRQRQSPLASTLGACVLATFSLVLAATGMEVTLTLPLLFLWTWYRLRLNFQWSDRELFAWSFLGSLLVLSRLDSLLLVATVWILGGVGLRFTLKQWLRRTAIYAAGSWAVALYLLSNRILFHTWLPISGQAKQLRAHYWPSPRAIGSFFLPLSMRIHMELSIPGGVAALCASVLLLRYRSRFTKNQYLVYWALVLFPFVYLLCLSCVTDWLNGTWSWYCYIFLPPIAALLAVAPWSRIRWFPYAALCLLLLLNIAIGAKMYSQVPARSSSAAKQGSYGTYAAGKWLAQFAQSHPGVYAMGDKAGAAGYLVHQPLVQLEGLMMDADYLKALRAQPNLNSVLKEYGVTYYVATNPRLRDGCYQTQEPAQAGSDSPKMIGNFCGQPIASFTYSSPGATGGVYHFLVFDVKQ